jgi:hypothetical protein
MANQMFKVQNPEVLSQPWRGAPLALNANRAFSDYVLKNLGPLDKRTNNINKFLDLPDVRQMLGDSFIQRFKNRDTKHWQQKLPIAIDFANSG